MTKSDRFTKYEGKVDAKKIARWRELEKQRITKQRKIWSKSYKGRIIERNKPTAKAKDIARKTTWLWYINLPNESKKDISRVCKDALDKGYNMTYDGKRYGDRYLEQIKHYLKKAIKRYFNITITEINYDPKKPEKPCTVQILNPEDITTT